MMRRGIASRSGLSLLELLVVIGILGVLLAALTSVGLRGVLDRGRLSESINIVETRVGEARRLSKRLDRDVTFEITFESGSWQTVVDGTARGELPGRTNVTSGATAIDFNAPFGTYGGADVRIDLDVNGVKGTVVVTGVLARTVVLR